MMLSGLAQDVRHAVRMLGSTPAFTMVCLLTMALSIGANTAIFSVIYGVLLKPLTFPDAGRLVMIGHHTDGRRDLDSTTPGNFYDWQQGTTAFDAMAAWATTARNLTGRASAERLIGVISAGSLFDVLGRDAFLGRTFSAAEDGPGAEAVIVLSYGLWQRLFGNDRTAVGQTLTLGGTPHTVIGVMPPDFAFPDVNAGYWIPARFDQAFRGNRDQYFLVAAARLKAGVSLEQAQRQIDTVMDRIRQTYPQATQNATGGVVPMKSLLVDNVRTRLEMLMGAVALVLLIACANLGNLLLARAAGRRREMALRLAIGARPLRVVRQVLTECLVLAGAGGLAGIALAGITLRSLLTLLPQDLPRAAEVRLDPTVLGFSIGLSALSGLACGMLPAIQLARRGPSDVLRDGSRGSTRGRWVRTGLVVSEVALALMLLAGAGLLIRSFARLLEVNPGFRAAQLLTFRTGVASAAYPAGPERVAVFERVREALATLPGVQSVAMMSDLPVTGRGIGAWFNIIDKPLPPDQTPPGIPYRVISHDALQALGIPLVAGRYFTPDDRLDGFKAVIVSRGVARRFWPGEDPIGQAIYLGAPDNRIIDEAVVVGIVADVKQVGLDEQVPATVYLPNAEVPGVPTFSFALRTVGDPATLTAAVRDRIRQIDPTMPVFQVRTMDEILSESVQPTRSSMLLLGLFAATALVLAVLGVFSVVSYMVTQRTKELGIRMALGAGARQVVLLVLGSGMLPVLAGIAIGLGGALVLTRFMESLLFGVSAADPATYAVAAALLAAVAGVASYMPARRALLVDPVAVLREE